ncbi:hypothetical protein ABVK25_009788 [Lepraria finkii]|uniref:Uncharacterized protein n=1 Tax=Lepraria finkii TaxID=1340010 RepID=A0ABR4AYZ6_9LECA
MRSYKWVIRDQGQFQQTPVIDAEWWEGYQRKILDIAEASYESDSAMPRVLRETIRVLEIVEIQALLRNRRHYHPDLQRLVESQELLEMLPEMQGYLSDKERERSVHLYNNLYF